MLKILNSVLICFLLVGLVPPNKTEAQSDTLPPPHLGYGLHLDPNVPVDPSVVDRLGMDWVKLYNETQIPPFQNKRILFRMDIAPTQDFEAFRAGIAQRASNLASLGVDAIEVHNEPNLSLEWQNRQPNAAEYVTLLREAYQAIKSVAPQIIVVSAGLAPAPTTADRMAVSDLEYAREMLQNGAGRWFDAFGYHPYGYNAAPEDDPSPEKYNFRRTELIWRLLREFGINKQIWLTEFGWLRDPAEDGVGCSESDPAFAGFSWMRVDGQTQADYIARAYAFADRYWVWAGPMFLWNLNFSQRANDGSLAPCSHMRWFGLLKFNGTPTLAFDRVASMPKRYSRYLPIMTLYSDPMTLEIGQGCRGRYEVGEFTVANTGYPGGFTATIEPANAPLLPLVEVSSESARSGEDVTLFITTTGMSPGLHIVYVNVRASIGGQLVAQNLRGFVIVQETGQC